MEVGGLFFRKELANCESYAKIESGTRHNIDCDFVFEVSSAMIALTWLGSELGAVNYAKVAVQDFSDESLEEFKESQLKYLSAEHKHVFGLAMTIVGTIMAIPYAVAVICFFLGIIKIANNITCMFACT